MVKVIVFPAGVAANEAEPPQLVNGVAPTAGFARITLAGRVSVNEVPVRFVFESLLLIVMVSVLTSPIEIVFGAKPLLNEGGGTPTTVNVALAGVVLEMITGVPASSPSAFKVLARMVLMRLPVVVDVTLIST